MLAFTLAFRRAGSHRDLRCISPWEVPTFLKFSALHRRAKYSEQFIQLKRRKACLEWAPQQPPYLLESHFESI